VRESLLDDLHEAFMSVSTTRGPGRARRWYWKQAVTGTPALFGMRRGQPREPHEKPTRHAIRAAGLLLQDLRQAVRLFVRRPGVEAPRFFVRAGIGINIAVLSAVDRIMFRPLPFGDAGRLVHLQPGTLGRVASVILAAAARQSPRKPNPSGLGIDTAIPGAVERWIWRLAHASLRKLQPAARSGGRPITGRDFTIDDARLWTRAVLLTDEALAARFGRSPEVFTRTLGAGRAAVHVVGILPPGFLSRHRRAHRWLDGRR
jgi:hypothetical protein